MMRLDDLPEGGRIVYDALSRSLRDVLGMDNDAAEQTAYHALRLVLEECGGEYLYIPKNIRLAAHSRDIEIWRAFTGRNQRELAREYGLTLQYIYRIIAVQRERAVRESQHELPLV